MTATGFAVFGGGLAWLSFVVVPYIRLTSVDAAEVEKRTRQAIRRCARRFMSILRAFGLLTFEGTGLRHLPASDSFVVAATHPTLIDAPFLLSEIPNIECIAKHQLARSFVFRHVFRAANYLTNEHPVEMTEQAIERLRSGAKLLIFPEGTRSGEQSTQALKPGAAAMAVRAECPVVPVTLTCDPPTLSYVNPWYRIPKRRVKLRYEIHPAILPNRSLSRREATHELNARLAAIMWGGRARDVTAPAGDHTARSRDEAMRETANS